MYEVYLEVVPLSEDILRAGGVILHPVRWKIISTLEDMGSPMYIGAVADAIGVDRRLVSFHLSTLEEKGFAKSRFAVIEEAKSLGKAGRFYTLTPKVERVKTELVKLIREKTTE